MATGTTVFSRVTVVAPRTRIDVALPADVAVADLVPLVVDMANERSADGGSRHGGWVLAKLGDSAPLDPSRSLASLGVLDGELLQLRKRSENPPPPLYDDVVDAIAESEPDSYRPWTQETARRIGHIGGGVALFAAALALFFGGSMTGGSGLSSAIIAGVLAIACTVAGAVLAKSYQAAGTGVVVAAAGGLPFAFVSGFYIVPKLLMDTNFLLACVLVVVFAAAGIMLIGSGIAVFIAAAVAGTIGALAALVGVISDQEPAGVAAITAAVALGLISVLPRATIWLAKLPLPHVPGSAEELKEDGGFPDFDVIERRTSVAHDYMTGLLIGCGAVVAIASVIAATASNIFGPLMAVFATLSLMLRARTYASGTQAIALLTMGMVATGGVMFGWMWSTDWFSRLVWIFPVLLLIAAGALIVGVVFPHQRFSPPMRRSVEILEAVCIAVVLPLALGAMGLFEKLRDVGSTILG